MFRKGMDDRPLLAFALRALSDARAARDKESDAYRFLVAVTKDFQHSHAQLFQDIFAILFLGGKRDGYFVEVGVGNGIDLSNTYMLERHYGWNGLLVEPHPAFHEHILRDRSAKLDRRALFSHSGALVDFVCSAKAGEFSGLRDQRQAKGDREGDVVISVETASLDDLLTQQGAPSIIDYMSIDTEGSEFQILQGLDTQRYLPLTLTVEHNFDTARIADLKSFLEPRGYRQVLAEFSQFDIWFVHSSATRS